MILGQSEIEDTCTVGRQTASETVGHLAANGLMAISEQAAGDCQIMWEEARGVLEMVG